MAGRHPGITDDGGWMPPHLGSGPRGGAVLGRTPDGSCPDGWTVQVGASTGLPQCAPAPAREDEGLLGDGLTGLLVVLILAATLWWQQVTELADRERRAV